MDEYALNALLAQFRWCPSIGPPQHHHAGHWTRQWPGPSAYSARSCPQNVSGRVTFTAFGFSQLLLAVCNCPSLCGGQGLGGRPPPSCATCSLAEHGMVHACTQRPALQERTRATSERKVCGAHAGSAGGAGDGRPRRSFNGICCAEPRGLAPQRRAPGILQVRSAINCWWLGPRTATWAQGC